MVLAAETSSPRVIVAFIGINKVLPYRIGKLTMYTINRTPIKPVGGVWHSFPNPRPYPAVLGVVYDVSGNTVLIHRGPNVRSAKNAWSAISGLHEVGYAWQEQLCIELEEEVGLAALEKDCKLITVYENISAEDAWHWVILMSVIQVKDVTAAVNLEPEKHDKLEIVSVFSPDFLDRIWTPGLGEALRANIGEIRGAIANAV